MQDKDLGSASRISYETDLSFTGRIYHFGTTGELLSLLTKEISDYEFLDWKPLVSANREECPGAVHNALIDDSVKIEENCYIESSMLTEGTVVHKGAVVSMVTLENIEVPENSAFFMQFV